MTSGSRSPTGEDGRPALGQQSVNSRELMIVVEAKMVRSAALALSLLVAPTAARATDFGIRVVGQAVVQSVGRHLERSIGDLGEAARVAAHFGRITSTLRSVAHNRAVGGVPNSYHLRGHALDVVRRRDVSHWQIAAALHQAGFHLIESLDEGDHSHFAFGGGARPVGLTPRAPASIGQTMWRIIVAPPSTETDLSSYTKIRKG